MKPENGGQAGMASDSIPAQAARQVEDRYRELTPHSRTAFERTAPLIPAGVPGGIVQYFPVPDLRQARRRLSRLGRG
jgi:hypothetical protein